VQIYSPVLGICKPPNCVSRGHAASVSGPSAIFLNLSLLPRLVCCFLFRLSCVFHSSHTFCPVTTLILCKLYDVLTVLLVGTAIPLPCSCLHSAVPFTNFTSDAKHFVLMDFLSSPSYTYATPTLGNPSLRQSNTNLLLHNFLAS
jgi:hypothetical protein